MLESFFATCPEMLFIAGLDGELLRWSDTMGRALGQRLTRGTSLSELAHPDDRAAVDGAWARLRGSVEPLHLTTRLVDASGGYRAVSLSARRTAEGDAVHGALREAPGGVEGAEDMGLLRRRAQLLSRLTDSLPVVVWAVDTQGRFTHDEGKLISKLGLNADEFLGVNVFERFAGEGAVLDALRRALSGEPVQVHQCVFGLHWVHWMTPFRGAGGEVCEVFGVSLDITETKRAEEELHARLQQIEKQQEVIRGLSTPIIEVWDGVLTLPMVGIVDSVRTAEVMDALLSRIVDKQARFAILDLTGVDVVDTRVAGHLVELVTAIRLLGAEGIVAGIKPTVAQTMVSLGLDLSRIVTHRNLRAALAYCIRRMSNEARAAAAPANGRGPSATQPNGAAEKAQD